MAVFRLALLVHVGFVIAHGGGGDRLVVVYGGGQTHHSHRLAHLHAPQRHAGEAAERRPSDVVDEFLHTGDSGALKQANCSRRYELTSLRGRSQESPHGSMSGVLDVVMQATNFLNMVLQANRSREQSLLRDVEWYHALVRSILLGDAKIHRAVVTFGTESSHASGPWVHLQATREGGEIVLQDLSGMARHHLHNRTADTEWFHGVKNRKKSTLHKRVLSQDFTSLDNALRRGESFIPDKTHIKWSAPYLECEDGNYVPRWLLTLSAAFYGLRPNLAPEFRGVVRVDINLQDVDIDQCSTDGWFAGTHHCNLTTMECLPMRGHGFVLDKFKCHCRKGFYHPSRVAVSGFTSAGPKGKAPDSSPNADEASSSDCLPCQPGCAFCKDDTPCVTREDGALRMAVLSFQCLCMLVVFVSMVLVYHFRRNKSIRASGLVLLEAILCGALLLYFPVGILYFQPSVFRCILLRWVRLLGFATVYGTLTLKLYRVLKVFLSRTAQRIPYMTSWRVLRLLAIILLIVCWFLVAWTSAVCQIADRKSALIDVGYTPDGLQFSMCLLDRWDYMMAVAEFLFLLWAVYLCYAVRTVPSAFHEPRYMAIAVHNELVLSAIFYVIRFTLAPELHPDWMLLLFFTHTHLTVTVTLGLLLIPKFLFAGTHMRDDIASEAYEDELDMGRSGSYLNSSITSAWSEHSLDPEDIREELKKLYSQLEIYKRKKMLANNPHLQKKRSSKKGLGRSLMRRITEIPESVHRQCSREEKDMGEHGSNRNSICMLKKNPFDQTVKPVKEETLKSKVFSLKKSHSSYDHVRDPSEDSSISATDKMEVTVAEGSLLDTLMGKKLVKKKSSENLNAPSESTESVPLVCKSASAHNLTADKKPLHPRASMLQKSLSVIATAKEKTLGLTAKTQSVEDSNKKTQSKCTREAENVEQKQNAPKGRSDPVKGKDLYDLSEVCPWEVEDLPTPSENKVQKHVSIAPKETTTVHGGSTKGGKSHQQKQKVLDPSPSGVRQKMVREEVCPWEDTNQTEAIKQQSTSQQPKTSREEVCPWDFGETTETCPATKQRKGTSPLEGQGRSTPTGSSLQPPASKADILPNPESPPRVSKPKEPPSKKRTLEREKETSKDREDEKSRTKTKDKSKPSDSQQRLAEVCPWDVDSHQEVAAVEKRKSANVGAAKAKQAEVCPWDFEDTSDKKDKSSVGRRSTPSPGGAPKKADVCPWDFEDKKA
ncbi:probable G-protein coupled receptor 158 isoform X2 [Dunckerocampus dactyliophorus]|uniref:probable G-protein coupled receptor 158 isoform X2 n=1 Tax=Dunckerocampus dactyliophorus TaxID=161453 RepID=UPI002404D42C|nr:probable G-protein coupled receptor 158 isoform X2 [Dunckerocampus dactyliophorus]